MDRYAYLLLGLCLLLPLAGMLLGRKDLAGKAIKLGVLGGVAGVVAEAFYFRDYWRPLSLFGTATISMEDFIFGFAITALSFSVYPFLSRAKFREGRYPRRARLYRVFFAAGLACMLFFNLGVHINSIFVSSAMFVFLSAIMVFLRMDLLRSGIYSALLLTAFIAAVYIFLFNYAAPHFWDNYWLLAGTKWDATVFGNVPLTELLWYFSWVFFASVSYPFVCGSELVVEHYTSQDSRPGGT